jgi:D-serine deaminase-like pyridoxal phosphate-dependent protein
MDTPLVVAFVGGVAAAVFLVGKRRKYEDPVRSREREGLFGDNAGVRDLLAKSQVSCPSMLVDLDRFDENLSRFTDNLQSSGKKFRLATKSVRVPYLIRRACEAENCAGMMCFSFQEAEFLLRYLEGDEGADERSSVLDHEEFDVFVAYPTVEEADLDVAWKLACESRTAVALMIDSIEQLDALLRRAPTEERRAGKRIPICVDVDMAFKPLGAHLGAHRSSLHSEKDFREILEYIREHAELVYLRGLMGYEAHVAGLPDDNPVEFPMWQVAKRVFKSFAWSGVVGLRSRYREILAADFPDLAATLRFVNGGGSGNFFQAAGDPSLTEVAVGSGLLQSQLFSYFRSSVSKCALVFALRVTRKPFADTICCQSGGFIASGNVSVDKQPRVFSPPHLSPFDDEGFGEVQTPLRGESAAALSVGDVVMFRPAKAGEIAERFANYQIYHSGALKAHRTYRGFGLTTF